MWRDDNIDIMKLYSIINESKYDYLSEKRPVGSCILDDEPCNAGGRYGSEQRREKRSRLPGL